jgi:DNA repair protein RadA/Sms
VSSKTRTKTRTVYVCQACGGQTPKWMGKCPDCDAWNTLVETLDSPVPAVARAVGTPSGWGLATPPPQPLSAVPAQRQARVQVPIGEFNRVLGGGIVSCSAAIRA